MKCVWVTVFALVLSVSLFFCDKSQGQSPRAEVERSRDLTTAAEQGNRLREDIVEQSSPAPLQQHSNNASDIITVFEDSIPAPAGMALAGDGTLFVVSKRDVGGVYRIRIVDGKNRGAALFASSLKVYEPLYIAVDANGFVYINSSRRGEVYGSRGTFSSGKPEPAGMFQISPDGRTFKRIEGFDDDTLGLTCDLEGNPLSCCCPPSLQEEKMSKFFDRILGKYFGGSDGDEPYIAKFEAEADSGLIRPNAVIKHLESRPSDIELNSKGDLFYVAGGTVAKISFGSPPEAVEPEVFASLPVENPEAIAWSGIGIDGSNNLYVGCRNIYSIAGGTVFKIDTAGNVTTFATGVAWPMDIVADPEGNIYISDMKTNKVFQVPASAQNLKGPFRIKKTLPPVKTVKKKPAPKEEHHVKTIETSQPASTAGESGIVPELEGPEETGSPVETEPDAEGNPAFPDTVVLKTGREMQCEIIAETDDSVRIQTSVGTASMSRDRVASLRYGTRPKHKAGKHSKYETGQFLNHVKEGRDSDVDRFLSEGMNPDVRDHNRRTALMLAAFEGHDEVVRTLLSNGADLSARDVDGWTALMYAAYGGKTKTVRLLIDEGADVNARVKSGQSVLTIAKQKRHYEVIRLLERAGAKW